MKTCRIIKIQMNAQVVQEMILIYLMGFNVQNLVMNTNLHEDYVGIKIIVKKVSLLFKSLQIIYMCKFLFIHCSCILNLCDIAINY